MASTIGDKRVRLALSRIGAKDGFAFEAFANAFLASEFESLRPVGGIHDGGRDAYIHSPNSEPTTFVQSSVTSAWEAKIRRTIETLRANRHAVVTLVYCTPHDIARRADSLKSELRKAGVHLDLRDAEYFVAFANQSQGRVAASETLSKTFVDPLLATADVIPRQALQLDDLEERSAVLYLQLMLSAKNPSQNVGRLAIESLVFAVLRNSTPENMIATSAIIGTISSLLGVASNAQLNDTVTGALQRLKKARRLTVYGSGEAYCLAHAERLAFNERTVEAAADEQRAIAKVAQRLPAIADELEVDYQYPVEALAKDTVVVLHHLLNQQGAMAAKSFANGDFAASLRASAYSAVASLLERNPKAFASKGELDDQQILDLVPPLLQELLTIDDADIRRHFRSIADSYFIRFLMRGTNDIKRAFEKLVGTDRIVVDASLIVPVLAETALPTNARRFTGLLKAATAAGIQLLLVDDIVNEVETHLLRLRLHNSVNQGATDIGVENLNDPLLVAAFKRGRKAMAFGSFDHFVDQFIGSQEPTRDLIEYLESQIGLKYANLGSEYGNLPTDDLEQLFRVWKQKKKRRPWVSEEAHDKLVWHDVRAYSLIQQSRRSQNGTYGHMWWWLTLDGTAFWLDRELRAGKGVSICMSPDFLLRYVSLSPKSIGAEGDVSSLLPLSAEVSASMYLPPELRERAEASLAEAEGMAAYHRKRKLRELLNSAKSETGELLETGISDLEAQLTENVTGALSVEPSAGATSGETGPASRRA